MFIKHGIAIDKVTLIWNLGKRFKQSVVKCRFLYLSNSSSTAHPYCTSGTLVMSDLDLLSKT